VALSVLKCFKLKLYGCICWLIVEVILRNARCNDEIHSYLVWLFTMFRHGEGCMGKVVVVKYPFRVSQCLPVVFAKVFRFPHPQSL